MKKLTFLSSTILLIALFAAACAPASPAAPIPPTDLPVETNPTQAIPSTGYITGVASTPIAPATEIPAGTPAVVGTPSTGPIPVGDNTEVTLANDGATLTMQVGQRFLLKLGEDYQWDVQPSDQAVLSRVKNIAVIRGAQGLYEALQPGTVQLTATGDPACRTSKPACGLPSRAFHITVIIK